MLKSIRTFLDSRWSKPFFVALIVPFVLWGIAGVAQNAAGGGSTAVATVAGKRIEPPDFQQAFRQQVNAVTKQLGGRTDPTPEMRRAIAGATLDRLVVQAAISAEVDRLGLVVPDEAVRQEIFAIPAFRGRTGAYDHATMVNVLQQNGYSESRFITVMRSDIGQRELMEAVQVGASAPGALVNQVFAFQHEQRVADLVELPFSAAPAPPAPSEDDLRSAYENDPQRYAVPEYRRVNIAVLSPDTIARTIDVPDAELQAYYDAHKAEFGGPERRSVEVVGVGDEAAAQTLAATWTGGADWAAMQKAAADAGGSAAALDDATPVDIPGADLADAVFKAAPNQVTGPVKTAFGWQVLRVTKVVPANEQPFEAIRDTIHGRVAHDRAVDQIYARSNQFEDALSAGSGLDKIPADIGVSGAVGTMDAKGMTPDGEPAPIPGSPAVRAAILASAFATPKGNVPTMIEGPDQSYYAILVEDETPPQVRPFDAVQAQVRDNWEHDQRRRAEEVIAAKLLAAARTGSLDDAATVAGVRAEQTKPIPRGAQQAEGVPGQLIEPLFAMKLNDATMIETPDGFFVAKLVSISSPDPLTDPAGAAQIRTALNRSVDQDVELTYAAALRDRDHPQVNRQLFESLAQ